MENAEHAAFKARHDDAKAQEKLGKTKDIEGRLKDALEELHAVTNMCGESSNGSKQGRV